MDPDVKRKIAIAALVGGGGLLAFGSLRRIQFKKIQAKKAKEAQAYSSTPSGSSGASVAPKGPAWFIQPGTIKLAPQLVTAEGLKKTVGLGKAGLITASTVKAGMEFVPSPGNPGLLGGMVTWGLSVQSWLFNRMKEHIQYTPFDRSRSRVACVMYKNRGAGEPRDEYFPVYNPKGGSTMDRAINKLPNIDYVVGWPFWGGGAGIARGQSTTLSSDGKITTSVSTPEFGIPSRGGYEQTWMSKVYWPNYGFVDDKCRMGSGDFVWRDSWIGHTFQVDQYPWRENMGNIGEIKPGGRHPRVEDYRTIHTLGSSSIPSTGAYAGYAERSSWLVWAAEWYRLCAPFKDTWFLGHLPKYTPAPKWWRDHCLSWGIGVANKWRWDNLYHPAWSGLIPIPGLWTGNIESLLREVVKWTPRPGSMWDKDTKRDVATDWVDRFPGVDWPTDTGTMYPFNRLPFGYWEGVSATRKAEVERAQERAKLIVNMIPSLVRTVTGDASVIEKVVDVVEMGIKLVEAFGISLGPVMPLFGVARIFTAQDMSANLFPSNPATYVTKAMEYLDIDNLRVDEQLAKLELKVDQIQRGIKTEAGEWVARPWPHMRGLIGKFQDLPHDMRSEYRLLYDM